MIAKTLFAVLFCLSVLLLLGAGTHLQGQVYYVDDGNNGLRPVYSGSPEDIRPDYWTVRLYRKGQKTGEKDNWGSITGDSAAEVMNDLRGNQQDEERNERLYGPLGASWTYRNPMGPIAGYYRKKTTGQYIVEIILALEKIGAAAKQIRTILQTEPKVNPYKNVGKTLKDYANNFGEIQKRTREVQKDLDTSEPRFRDIAGQLAGLSSQHETMLRAIQGEKNGRLTGRWAHQSFKEHSIPNLYIDTTHTFTMEGNELHVTVSNQQFDSDKNMRYDVETNTRVYDLASPTTYLDPTILLPQDSVSGLGMYVLRIWGGRSTDSIVDVSFPAVGDIQQAVAQIQSMMQTLTGRIPQVYKNLSTPEPKPTVQFNPKTVKFEKTRRTLPASKSDIEFNPKTKKWEKVTNE